MKLNWTKEMIDYLTEQYSILGPGPIAAYFGLSKQQIIKKAYRLGLKAPKYWTPERDQLLAIHFENGSKSDIMNLFPEQSWVAILQRGLKTLELRRNSQTKYSLDYTFFEGWSEQSAYVLGFIMADGYIKYQSGKRNENSLQFELAEYDKDILEQIKDAMDWAGPISTSNRNTVKLNIGSKKICEDLIKLGVPAKDKSSMATWPIGMPDQYNRHFIRGLMDGDGTITKERSSIKVELLGTHSILQSLSSKLPIEHGSTVRQKCGLNVYRIAFSYNKAKSILKWLYEDATIYSNRKHRRYLELISV